MSAYYNENDPFAVAWLRELIKDGLIADGIVDDRSILDVEASDLTGFDQHHFFAGIGGWSYALRLAGWADNRSVCTASLPCQPFSVAGKGEGKNDERHLLPHFMQLVREFDFNTIMGEQVEAAIRHGWLDDIQAEMGRENYSTGAVVLGAHSVNAPHKRQRVYWIAERMGNAEQQRLEGLPGYVNKQGGRAAEVRSCSETGFWSNTNTAYCRDGKHRPIPTESALFPVLFDGFSNRVGALRGAGNAIVPAVGAEVIKAYMGYDNEKMY